MRAREGHTLSLSLSVSLSVYIYTFSETGAGNVHATTCNPACTDDNICDKVQEKCCKYFSDQKVYQNKTGVLCLISDKDPHETEHFQRIYLELGDDRQS